jgi:UDP-glucose 4-epimerase
MKVFITGGCGFIGANMAAYHLEKGDEVHVIDNLYSGSLGNIAAFINHPNFKFSFGNFLTWEGLPQAVLWAQRIYNFAAVVGVFNVIEHPMSTIKIGFLGCHHLLHTVIASKNKPTILLASSSIVYGDNPAEFLAESTDLFSLPPSHPVAAYAASKLCDEIMGYSFYKYTHIPTIIARIFNTIGPKQTGIKGMVVPRFIKQALNHEPITIFGDGQQCRSFCDVRDLVIMLDLLASNPKAAGEIINVGNDVSMSINSLANLVAECFGKPIETKHIPYEEVYGVGFTDVKRRCPNLKKLRSLINYKPQWDLKATIMDLLHHDTY